MSEESQPIEPESVSCFLPPSVLCPLLFSPPCETFPSASLRDSRNIFKLLSLK